MIKVTIPMSQDDFYKYSIIGEGEVSVSSLCSTVLSDYLKTPDVVKEIDKKLQLLKT